MRSLLSVFFTMGKMVIFSKYIIWTPRAGHFRDTPNSYISSPILQQYHFTFPIIPLYYYCTTAKKTGSIELISTVGSLHIGPFLLHTSPFSIGSTRRIVCRKRPLQG
jgi:hypothetical protein